MRTSCSKCGGTEFYKNRDCKFCERIRRGKYKEKKKIRDAKKYAQNSEAQKAMAAKWRADNPEKQKASVAAYHVKNATEINSRHAQYKKANPEQFRIYEQNRLAKKRNNGGKLSKGLAAKLLELQQGRCACCRNPLETYHLDHIMPIALEGSNTDDNIQLLCPTCNQQKYATHPIDFMQSKGFLL